MPRRKITIEEAFSVLQQAGIQVQVKAVEPVTEDQPIDIIRKDYTTYPPTVIQEKPNSRTVKVTLYAKHSVGSGGFSVKDDNGQHIESSGVTVYGPGIITVPTALAPYLLHQDSLARQADNRMLETTQRRYLVVQRGAACVGLPVGDGVLDNLGILGDNFMLQIR